MPPASDGNSALISGTYTATLRVTDADGASHTDTTQVTVSDVAPTAQAGGPYAGNEGSSIAFAGTATDAGEDIVLYEWDFESDGTYDHSSAANGTANHVYVSSGIYTATLRVTDDNGAWDTDSVQVTVNNVVPTAEAGGPYSLNEGSSVTLAGLRRKICAICFSMMEKSRW